MKLTYSIGVISLVAEGTVEEILEFQGRMPRNDGTLTEDPIDWSVVPEPHNWVATDSNGGIYSFKSKPEASITGCWLDSEQSESMVHIQPYCSRELWESSLRERPNG